MTAAAGVLVLAPDVDGATVDLRVARDGADLTWQAMVADRVATAAELDAAVCAGLAAGVPVCDTRGARLLLRPGPGGLLGAFGGSAPMATGWSTNTVSLLRLGDTPVVHKRYRHSRPELTEADALRVLHGSDLVPSLIGSYTYVDHAGVHWPLGVLSDQVPGVGLDEPLRADLRGRIGGGPTTPRPDTVRLLVAFGATLRRFHRRLAATAETEVALDRRGLLTTAADEIGGLDLGGLRGTTGGRIRAALAGALDAARGPVWRPGPAGPCHGDLHLGHVLVDRSGPDADRLRLVDLSPPSLSAADAVFARQHPWQDLVSLSRALEYFTIEEAHRHVAEQQGTSEDTVTAAALAGTTGVGGAPGPELRQILVAESAVAPWRHAAFAAILRGYGGTPDIVENPLYRLLFLRRLVHELRYDLAHGRTRYAAMNLRRALDLPR